MVYRRIRDLREDKDISQTQMGKILNVSQRDYSHYETGTRRIPVDILVNIADFHNVSIDYLVERTDRKEVNR
ncbi:MAG: helix-turn-helix domain-containing protein [Lachnospiraceae bacterium]